MLSWLRLGSGRPCARDSRDHAAHSGSRRCRWFSSGGGGSGIADGRGFAAALALGASGAWIGTRFLASNEVAIHPHYRKRLLEATEDDTVYLEELFDIGWPRAPHRVLRNSTVAAWETAGRPPTGTRPGEGEVVATSKSRGPIVRYRSYTPGADAEGDIDALSLWAGQSVALVHKVQPAAEIVREIVSEAQTILRRLNTG